MPTGEIKMTEKESLELITSMINKAKENRVNESGTLYLLWGWIILFCCAVQFVGLTFFQHTHECYIWFWALTWVVLIVQVIYLWIK